MKINKNTIKKGLYIVLGIGLILGAVGLVRDLINKEDDGFEKVHLSYEIGGLDETGKYEETKGSLYTKKAIELNARDELQFTLDFENDIQYQLFFYDGNDEFVSSSEVLTKNHKYVAESDTSVRVLITPIWDEDVAEEDRTINLLTKGKYTKQLSVELKQAEELDLSKCEKLTIGEYDVYYEDGMTWREWVESPYNTFGASFYNSELLTPNGDYVKFPNGTLSINGEMPPKYTADNIIDPTLEYTLV